MTKFIGEVTLEHLHCGGQAIMPLNFVRSPHTSDLQGVLHTEYSSDFAPCCSKVAFVVVRWLLTNAPCLGGDDATQFRNQSQADSRALFRP